MGADATSRFDVPILKILENASTDSAVVTGDGYVVDRGGDYLVFDVKVATGGVVEIQGLIRHQSASGTVTDSWLTFDTFGTSGSINADGRFVALNNPPFSQVRAKTTTKPSAGTAYVLMNRG